jgi:hypothetical protein
VHRPAQLVAGARGHVLACAAHEVAMVMFGLMSESKDYFRPAQI